MEDKEVWKTKRYGKKAETDEETTQIERKTLGGTDVINYFLNFCMIQINCEISMFYLDKFF